MLWSSLRKMIQHLFAPAKNYYVVIRVGATLTDLGAHLTQGVLLGTDQRLLKPFFDILKNRGEATSQSYFIEAVYLLTLRGRLILVSPNFEKWF